MKAEMDGLLFRGGYGAAWDDVSDAELISKLVKEARELEMDYFKKVGVYERVPRSHPVYTGGKIIAYDGST